MKSIARFLIRLALRLAPTLPVLFESREDIIERAVVLVDRANAGMDPGTAGEYKRHYVYGILQKEFPDVAKRVLSRCIELAVEQVS